MKSIQNVEEGQTQKQNGVPLPLPDSLILEGKPEGCETIEGH